MKKILLILGFCATITPAWADNNYKEYGIALALPQRHVEAAQKMHEEIYARLSLTQNLPNVFHITLFQGRFLQGQVNELFLELKKQHFKKVKIKLKQKIEVEQDRYITWPVKKNNDLEKLHKNVVTLLNSYHHGIMSRYIDSYNSLNKKQQQQIEKYGMAGVLGEYNPHVTLFFFTKKNSNAEIIGRQISIAKINQGFQGVDASQLVIGELGYNGNIENILYKIELE